MKPYPCLILLPLLAACSKPNYIYQFPNKNQSYHSSLATSTIQTKSVAVFNHGLEVIHDSSVLNYPTANSKLLASTSNPSIIINPVDHRSRNTISREASQPITFIKPVINQEGDPKKNAAAIIGFALSIASLSVFFGFLFAPILSIIAMKLCSIGLKSEKKKMAKFGMVVSIITLTVGFLILLYVVAIGGYDM